MLKKLDELLCNWLHRKYHYALQIESNCPISWMRCGDCGRLWTKRNEIRTL